LHKRKIGPVVVSNVRNDKAGNAINRDAAGIEKKIVTSPAGLRKDKRIAKKYIIIRIAKTILLRII